MLAMLLSHLISIEMKIFLREIKFSTKPPGQPANKKNFDGFRFILDVFRAALEELVHACLDPGEFTVFS